MRRPPGRLTGDRSKIPGRRRRLLLSFYSDYRILLRPGRHPVDELAKSDPAKAGYNSRNFRYSPPHTVMLRVIPSEQLFE